MDENKETVNARFVGDPADDFKGASNITMFGQDFVKGKFTEVSDPNAIRKLRGHSHFEIEGEGEREATHTTVDDLPPLGLEALKDVARSEGVEFDDDTTKAKLIRAIRAKRKRDAE